MSLTRIEMGNRIKAIRERHGFTQSQLAEAAGTTAKTIVSIEKGHKSVRVDLVLGIAKQLDTSPAVLMGLSPAWGKVISVIPDLDESKVPDVIRVIQGLLKPASLEEIKSLSKKPGSGSDQTKRKV